jgi:DNA-binding NtrC family response regulator
MAIILLVEGDPLQAFLCISLLKEQFGRQLGDVQRVDSAAEALCLVEQPQFAENLGLVISGHHLPGIGGPAFVAELCERLPEMRVLVLGNETEAARDYYQGQQVSFLPVQAPCGEMARRARQLLAHPPPQNTAGSG